MPYALILLALILTGCSSPTAPSLQPAPIVPVPPPVVTSTPAPNPLLSDPGFDAQFYRDFAFGARDLGGRTTTLQRHTRPPLFYVMTVDTRGVPIDARTLDATAAALINTAPIWNGGMGIEGLRFGTAEPTPPPCPLCAPDPSIAHHISVKWDGVTTNSGLCAQTNIGGNVMTIFLRTPGCAPCLGLAVAPVVIKHELGHALGFWHTDRVSDVMGTAGTATCDLDPSARERLHARVAYSMPPGSAAP